MLRFRKSDYLGRYYTDSIVGKTLVDAMELTEPEVIMDLGGGFGSLSLEASKVWLNSKFVSVDIDDGTSICHTASNVVHHVTDVLDHNLHLKIEQPLHSADAAICNPPYIKSLWRDEFRQILMEAGLDQLIPTMGEMSADVLFIAQNLRFLKTGGKLGLILPDGVITGERSLNLRAELLKKHSVEKVIELPRGVFKSTDAKAHIVIITKGELSTRKIQLNKLNKDLSLSTPIIISQGQAIERMDYSYFFSGGKLRMPGNISFETINSKLTRGSLNSRQVRNSDTKIFHSTDFLCEHSQGWPDVPRAFRLSRSTTATVSTTIAKKGDILLCRVGRNLHTKVAQVPNGFVAISDCVYRLELPINIRSKVFSFLTSHSGIQLIRSISHGVGARYMSKKDVIELVLAGIEHKG